MGIKESLISVAKRVFPETKRRRGAVWLVERRWQIEVEGEENLERAREHLRQGSLIVIFNHSFSGDAFCSGAVCLKAFGEEVKHLAIPAAKKHLDLKRALRNFMFQEEIERSEAEKLIRDVLVIRALAGLINMEVVPIVQSHDQEYYGEEVATRSWIKMLKRWRESLSWPGTVLLYSPEGHRSEDGNLQKAKSGLLHLLEMGGEDCLCLPMGIFIKERRGIGLNFEAEVAVVVGELFDLDDLRQSLSGRQEKKRLSRREKRFLTDRVMVDHLSPLIPAEQRGYYRDSDLSSLSIPLNRLT